VNTRSRPWLRAAGAAPRRAAVSAFGFGGTNFHVVLEEHADDQRRPYRLHQTAHELIVAAPTPAALQERCAALAEAMAGPQAARAFAELAEATRAIELPAEQARLGFVADGPAEAREQLLRAAAMLGAQPAAERLQHPKGVFYQRRGIDTAGRVVALFPGQGSQYLEMGRELALNFPPLRELLGRADAHSPDVPLSEVLFPPPAFTPAAQAAQAERLQRTEYAQPAIGALSAGMFNLLREAGFQPAMVAGHSFGELTALWAAGAIADDDYLALAHARGRAMAPPADPSFDAGAMLAVAAEPAAVQAIAGPIPGITAANLNARDQVVLAGPTAAIGRARELLQAAGHSATPLPVSAAFHTPLVGHAHEPFSRAVHACAFSPPRLPVYANATAQPYPADPRAAQALLADQLLQPVRFLDQIERIYAAGGAIFVEVGPRSVLTNLVKRILGERPHIAVALNPSRQDSSDRQLREAVVQLRVAGVPMRGIDPYQREATPLPARKRRGPTVRLNGSNYVSEKTRADYADAIADAPASSEPIISEEGQIVTKFPEGAHLPAQERYQGPAPTHQSAAPAPASPAELMAQLQAHQREILQVHQQFLTYQHEYVGLLLQLPQSAAAHHEGGLAAMHQLQAETLRIHQQFLAQQGDYAAGLLQLIQQQVALGLAPAAPVTNGALPASVYARPASNGASPAPIFAPEPPAPSFAPEPQVTNGTPPAPIFAPPTTNGTPPAPIFAPEPPAPSFAPPATNGTPPAPSFAPEPPAPSFAPPATNHTPPAPKPAAPAPAAAAPDPALTEGLLTVVSEKTGYPRETLELGMDMESDLGIDSIKRVDILGTMQTRFTLPRLAPEELAELRTLAQVVAHLQAAAPAPAAAAGAAAAPAPVSYGSVAVAPATLTRLPAPDQLEAPVIDGWSCVITDDGTEAAAALAAALAERGWQPVVLRLPASLVGARPALPRGVGRVALQDMSEGQLTQALGTIAESYGPVGGFIHLHPRPAALPQTNGMLSDAEQQIVRLVFLAARQLAPALTTAGRAGRALFMAVTRMDGELGAGMARPISPIGGGLFGLVKSLRQEWGGVFCRAVDLSPELGAEQAARLIVAESADPDMRLAEVGYGPRGRVTLSAELSLGGA
jgi:malonyl CoA-acyl carrier protein transacylase